MDTADYSTVKTVNDINIARADGKYASALEQRAAHLYEKARFLFAQHEAFSLDLPSAFREMIKREPTPSPAGAILKHDIEMMLAETERLDDVYASRALLDLYSEKEPIYLEDFFSPAVQTPSSIAYLKNALTDSAYKTFAKAVYDASVLYTPDFNAVCEAVYYEKTGYCILPIESSADGRLAGFYYLIDKYELNIVLSCKVISHGGSAFTTYVLCGKNPAVMIKDTESRLVEIQIRHTGQELRNLLNAADCYGLENIKCENLPTSDGNTDSVLFSGSDIQIKRLLYYLFLTGSRHTLLGVYSEIS